MTNQRTLRRRIDDLERMQMLRVERTESLKIQLDAVIEKKQREIENLRAQLTIRSVTQ